MPASDDKGGASLSMGRRTKPEGRQGVANAEQGRPGGAVGTGAAARLGTVRVVLWLVAAVLAARQMAVVRVQALCRALEACELLRMARPAASCVPH
ncbi:hypothetical protein [Streptomyces phaeochromogenes]|uniref:hypothetical protein n=2 Tax=Streptomyces phaeochromogenes TaxID=1923 RepID=UPI0038704CE1|nr:hypothetical protein OG277_00760 [Streptomyces phaeochromogenes]